MTDENAIEKKLDEMQDDEEREKGAENNEKNINCVLLLSIWRLKFKVLL